MIVEELEECFLVKGTLEEEPFQLKVETLAMVHLVEDFLLKKVEKLPDFLNP